MKNETKNEIMFFIKFGEKKNILDLYENGTLFFNTIEYFRKLENEQGVRGDNYEGTLKLTNFTDKDKVDFQITNPETGKIIKLKPTKLHLREFLSDIKGNLYSLYSLKTPEILDLENFKIDERVKEFGDYFIIIHNPSRFIDSIIKQLDSQKISYKAKLVSYYEKTELNGEISLFDKPSEFEYQKEYRIVLYNNESKPIKIKIDSLKEYSSIFKSDSIEKMKIDLVDKQID